MISRFLEFRNTSTMAVQLFEVLRLNETQFLLPNFTKIINYNHRNKFRILKLNSLNFFLNLNIPPDPGIVIRNTIRKLLLKSIHFQSIFLSQ